MKKKSLYLGLVGVVLTATMFLVYPLLKGEAQQSQEKVERQNEALQKVREDVTASMFYDNVRAKDSEWNLENAFIRESTTLVFEKSGEEVKVLIREYDSVEKAKKDFSFQFFSQGSIQDFTLYGDEGRKVFTQDNDFDHLEFRKGRFRVYIDCRKDEKTAERFAGYASDAITQ